MTIKNRLRAVFFEDKTRTDADAQPTCGRERRLMKVI